MKNTIAVLMLTGLLASHSYVAIAADKAVTDPVLSAGDSAQTDQGKASGSDSKANKKGEEASGGDSGADSESQEKGAAPADGKKDDGTTQRGSSGG